MFCNLRLSRVLSLGPSHIEEAGECDGHARSQSVLDYVCMCRGRSVVSFRLLVEAPGYTPTRIPLK